MSGLISSRSASQAFRSSLYCDILTKLTCSAPSAKKEVATPCCAPLRRVTYICEFHCELADIYENYLTR
jgi:hypothetical protein